VKILIGREKWELVDMKALVDKTKYGPQKDDTSTSAHMNRVIKGFRAHGEDVTVKDKVEVLKIARDGRRLADYDLYVCWSAKHGTIFKRCDQLGIPWIVVERAYLGDRFLWTSMGYGGLKRDANYCNEDVAADRWEEYWRDKVRPWKEGGDYALVAGQVKRDSAVKDVDIEVFYRGIIKKARQHYDKVLFKPHPKAKETSDYGADGKLQCPLEYALKGAEAVICYNSNISVNAVMAGVPTVVFDGQSMAWEVTSHDLDKPLYRSDRDDWGRRIAYTQWLPEEIEVGQAWEHLKRGYKNA